MHVTGLKLGINLLRFLHGQLSAQSRNGIIAYHQPAAEGFIFTSTAVDGNANIRILIFITLFGSSGERKLDSLENHVLIDAFLVRDGFHYQQDLFTHGIALPSKESIHLKNFLNTLFKNRNDTGLFNAVERQQVFVVIHHYHHLIAFNPLDQTLKLAPAFKGHTQLDLYLVTDKGLELFETEQRPFHPREETSRVYSLWMGSSTSITPLTCRLTFSQSSMLIPFSASSIKTRSMD